MTVKSVKYDSRSQATLVLFAIFALAMTVAVVAGYIAVEWGLL